MIDAIYLAQVDNLENSLDIDTISPSVIEKVVDELQKGGLFYTKTVGRFELTKKLPEKAESFDEMFEYADAFGKLRLAYIDSAHEISTEPKVVKQAYAFGGEVGINTATYNGIGFHLSGYLSQNINFLNSSKDNVNEDFFNTDIESFIYLSEASINYTNGMFDSKIGRVKVETPYANSDDIRIAPNTFEGFWIGLEYTDKLKSQFMYLNRWAGYDSQDEDAGASQDKFKDLVNDEAFGMFTASLIYEYAEDNEISIWYNYIDDMSSIIYVEIVGALPFADDEIYFDYGLQVSHLRELNNSSIAGTVLGAMAIVHYKGVSITGAYNSAIVDDGNYVTNGFGGGPYYTSLDEATIEAISEGARKDSEAFRLGAGYELSRLGLNGLVFEVVYGELYSDANELIEKDAILTYNIGKWSIEAIYTNYESSSDNNTFDRYLGRIDYSF